MNGLFFTGTDTGVGKTFVTAAVARLLRRQGRAVRVCKPVATGARRVAGRWVSDDTLQLAEAAGQADELERVTPWAFPELVAPPVAARIHGVSLNIAEMAAAVSKESQPGSILLVEGVGGLLCPLTERETVADLALMIGFPLVVVARRSLGTLNHTLLTLEVARARRLPVAGVVVNETSRPEGLAEETNVAELAKRIGVPLLAVVPYQTVPLVKKEGDEDTLSAVDWWGLSQGGSRETKSQQR